MPCTEKLLRLAFQEALIMLRHDFEGAKIRLFKQLFTTVLKNVDYLGIIRNYTIVTGLPIIIGIVMETGSYMIF
ncbi:hypothetical protein [Ferruginibacter sp.]|nr:hypothetical protein [Ferruginibacter sp.]